MKSPPFEYMTAQTVAEAVQALAAADGAAKLLAGGQSLVPMLNFRLLHPAMLVDINPPGWVPFDDLPHPFEVAREERT